MFEIKRTPEDGHTPECFAKAMITSIENWRDIEGIGIAGFRQEAQRNTFMLEADEFLAHGMIECLCDPV